MPSYSHVILYNMMYRVVLQLHLSLSPAMDVQLIIPWMILSDKIFQSV